MAKKALFVALRQQRSAPSVCERCSWWRSSRSSRLLLIMMVLLAATLYFLCYNSSFVTLQGGDQEVDYVGGASFAIPAKTNQTITKQQQQQRAAIVYLANENQMVRNRKSCRSIYHSLESLSRHFPNANASNTDNNNDASVPSTRTATTTVIIIIILHDLPITNWTRGKIQHASPFPVKFHELDNTLFHTRDARTPINATDITYRNMCNFWFRLFFELDLNLPEYVMRLDTDTCLTSNLPVDPFDYMQQYELDYMWHSTFFDPPNVIVNLSNFVIRHYHPSIATTTTTDHNNHHDPMKLWTNNMIYSFSTNLEWFRMSAFRRPDIVHWTNEVEQYGGIYRYRWGDAPLRTIVVVQFFNLTKVARFCNFTYNHSTWAPYKKCDVGKGKFLTDEYGWRVSGNYPTSTSNLVDARLSSPTTTISGGGGWYTYMIHDLKHIYEYEKNAAFTIFLVGLLVGYKLRGLLIAEQQQRRRLISRERIVL